MYITMTAQTGKTIQRATVRETGGPVERPPETARTSQDYGIKAFKGELYTGPHWRKLRRMVQVSFSYPAVDKKMIPVIPI